MKTTRNRTTVVMMTMATLSFVAAHAPAGLIGHWKFDEGSGSTAVDSSANGNDATQSIAAGGWIAGKAGGAYNLPRFWTPANPAGLQPTGAVSVSAWVNPNAAQANWTCLAGFEGTGTGYDVYSLKVSSDASAGGIDHLQFLIPGGPNNCGSTDTLMNYSAATEDGWVHVVAVFDPATSLSLYVNHSLDKSVPTALASLPQKPAARFNMGRYSNTGSYTYNGAIDDVQVYDQALTADDVTFLYNNPGSTLGGVPGGDDIPEPATMALLGLAVCGLGGYVRKRRKA